MSGASLCRLLLASAACIPPILSAAPQLNDATIGPAAIPAGQPVPVVFSVRLAIGIADPPFILGSMNAFRVDSNGRVLGALGSMRDDGTNGDVTAGDNVFSLRFTANEPAPGTLRLAASAAFRGMLVRTWSLQAIASVGGATPTVGVGGGTVRSSGGASITILPGALNTVIPVTLADVPPAGVGAVVPNGYSFIGAVSVNLNGASLGTEADLAVQVTSAVSERPIVARVVSMGTANRLTLVDTASIGADGLLHTNSPPFPGVTVGGTYAFLSMPSALGIVGLTVRSAGGQPVNGATVVVVPRTLGASVTPAAAKQSLDSLSAFVGTSGVDGRAFVPGAIPRTEVVATGILSPPTGASTIGAIDMPLTDILSGGILGTLMDQLVVDKIYPDLPPVPSATCECSILSIDPSSMPAPPFTPGESQQLTVACGGKDVTQSDSADAATMINNLLLGLSADFTFYHSSAPRVATVSHGEITAMAPGKVDIVIHLVSIKVEKIGEVLRLFRCEAKGGIPQLEVQALLTISKSGTGTGTVMSSPAGINCGPACPSQSAPFNGVVQLTASAGSGSLFTGWTGDCTATAHTTTVNVIANRSCTATFIASTTVYVVKKGTGAGTVLSEPLGISCGQICSAVFSAPVQLTAMPNAASRFAGWTGACTGINQTVSVPTSANTVTCEATFEAAYTISEFGVNVPGGPLFSEANPLVISPNEYSLARLTLRITPPAGPNGGAVRLRSGQPTVIEVPEEVRFGPGEDLKTINLAVREIDKAWYIHIWADMPSVAVPYKWVSVYVTARCPECNLALQGGSCTLAGQSVLVTTRGTAIGSTVEPFVWWQPQHVQPLRRPPAVFYTETQPNGDRMEKTTAAEVMEERFACGGWTNSTLPLQCSRPQNGPSDTTWEHTAAYQIRINTELPFTVTRVTAEDRIFFVTPFYWQQNSDTISEAQKFMECVRQ